MASPRPDLSIVVIGLDEGERLRRCLESILSASWPPERREVLYVDSGSSDGSLELASGFQGVRPLLLDDPAPNAAKGRNAGWRAATGELVQFLDGDMELDPAWLEIGAATLADHPQAAQVHGALVERDRNNLFHRIFELDLSPRTGPVQTSGGAALYRREALVALEGFDETLPEGEEPDLCWRIRNRLGLQVLKRAERMCTHDLGMHSLGAWWRRTARCGRAYAAVAPRFWKSADPLWRKELTSILMLGGLFPLAGIACLALWNPWPLAGLVLLLGLLIVRKAWQFRERAGSLGLALAYGASVYLGRLPHFVGAIGRLAGRGAR